MAFIDVIKAKAKADKKTVILPESMDRRTFEAAAFLRRNGADITRVRKLFKNDLKDYNAAARRAKRPEIDWERHTTGNLVDISSIWNAMDPQILMQSRMRRNCCLAAFPVQPLPSRRSPRRTFFP